MRKTAKQIVASLLEYGINPDAPAPQAGGESDPWRQGGHSKLNKKTMKFTGPVWPKNKKEDKAKQPAQGKEAPSRFKWKPPE